MAQMTMVQAIQDALRVALREDPSVIVLGEDVGLNGGVFRVTEGLQKKHGLTRCFDTPIGEAGIVAVSDDGKPIATAKLARQVMDYCESLDLPVIEHSEDVSLAAGAVMREGVAPRAAMPALMRRARGAHGGS